MEKSHTHKIGRRQMTNHLITSPKQEQHIQPSKVMHKQRTTEEPEKKQCTTITMAKHHVSIDTPPHTKYQHDLMAQTV